MNARKEWFGVDTSVAREPGSDDLRQAAEESVHWVLGDGVDIDAIHHKLKRMKTLGADGSVTAMLAIHDELARAASANRNDTNNGGLSNAGSGTPLAAQGANHALPHQQRND